MNSNVVRERFQASLEDLDPEIYEAIVNEETPSGRRVGTDRIGKLHFRSHS